MSGGGGKSKPASQAVAAPVPQTNLKTTGYGGMGYTDVPQTFTAQGKPAWMRGVWDMPTWGQSAANPGQAAFAPPATAPASPGKGPNGGFGGDLNALIKAGVGTGNPGTSNLQQQQGPRTFQQMLENQGREEWLQSLPANQRAAAMLGVTQGNNPYGFSQNLLAPAQPAGNANDFWQRMLLGGSDPSGG
jgi:hypothetical protein